MLGPEGPEGYCVLRYSHLLVSESSLYNIYRLVRLVLYRYPLNEKADVTVSHVELRNTLAVISNLGTHSCPLTCTPNTPREYLDNTHDNILRRPF